MQGEKWLGQSKMGGHSRMMSSDTVSTTCSGWPSSPEGQFGHSRTASMSSQAGSYESGETPSNMRYARASAYQSSMSPQQSMQPMMPVFMGSCDEYQAQAAPNEYLSTMPAHEAQAMNVNAIGNGDEHFPRGGNVLGSMPPTSAVNLAGLECKEPPPPPAGVPMVSGVPQTWPAVPTVSLAQHTTPPSWSAACHNSQPQSPSNQSEQMALSLPIAAINEQSEQQQQQPHPLQCPSGPVSPYAYMTCGNQQYMLVPVPEQQCDNSPDYAASPMYEPSLQAKNGVVHQQHQQWGACQEYQHNQGACMAGPCYQSDQQHWAVSYEASASPYGAGMAGVTTQWW